MGFLDVLDVRLETAHTNLLGWLLNPHEDHGLGASVLSAFTKRVIGKVPNLGTAVIRTERIEVESRADITITTKTYYLLVENKINHSAFKTEQLRRHALGAKLRCQRTNREPRLVLIVPDK